jgi:hypothetical protein
VQDLEAVGLILWRDNHFRFTQAEIVIDANEMGFPQNPILPVKTASNTKA